jgi:ABC-type uncharacterized transport system YnjBCD ATPase subunit
LTRPGCRFYAFLPALRLAVCGDAAALQHFDREYGPRALADGHDRSEVSIQFASEGRRRSIKARVVGRSVRGGHKSVRWTVALSGPSDRPVHAAISLRGWPTSFGLSLVQGYFVEALVSLAAPGSGHVLLPAAAIDSDDGPVLILGPSGAGKSSLSARALARGRIVIGDDQVLLDATGRCTTFPRRMRFYPDLKATAPEAYCALPGRTRGLLRARGIVDRLTGGYVRPSLVVDPVDMGGSGELGSGAIRRVLLLEPRAPVVDMEVTSVDMVTLLSAASRLCEAQRARLWSIAPEDWRQAIAPIAAQEEEILRSALDGLPLERVQIPAEWPPKRSIEALAQLIGVTSEPMAAVS